MVMPVLGEASSALQKVSSSLTERRAKLERNAKVALILVAGLVAAPVTAIAIGGLVGIGVAAFLGFGMLAAMKPMSMKFANWRLKAIKAEARKNPIESTENVYIQNERTLQIRLDEITAFEGKVATYTRQVADFSKRFPNEAPRFQEHLAAMKGILEQRRYNYKKTKKDQAELHASIERARAIWEMSLASEDINTDAEAGEEVMRKIVVDTALEEVQRRADASMASLNSLMLKEYVPPAFTLSSGQVLDLPADAVGESTPLHRGVK